MSLEVIIGNDVTLDDLYKAYEKKGVEFIITDGQVKEVIL